jgi:thymidine kinase
MKYQIWNFLFSKKEILILIGERSMGQGNKFDTKVFQKKIQSRFSHTPKNSMDTQNQLFKVFSSKEISTQVPKTTLFDNGKFLQEFVLMYIKDIKDTSVL